MSDKSAINSETNTIPIAQKQLCQRCGGLYWEGYDFMMHNTTGKCVTNKYMQYFKDAQRGIVTLTAANIGIFHGAYEQLIACGLQNWIRTSDLHDSEEKAMKSEVAKLYVSGTDFKWLISAVEQLSETNPTINFIDFDLKHVNLRKYSNGTFYWSAERVSSVGYIYPMKSGSKVASYKSAENCVKSLTKYLTKYYSPKAE